MFSALIFYLALKIAPPPHVPIHSALSQVSDEALYCIYRSVLFSGSEISSTILASSQIKDMKECGVLFRFFLALKLALLFHS